MTRPVPVQVWVHPCFKKRLKTEAAQKGVNIIEMTKDLGETQQPIKDALNNAKRPRFPRFRWP